jgi:hypothetical protein
LREWDVYDRDHGARDEWQVARLLSLLCNINRSKDQPSSFPQDFMHGYDPPPPDEDQLDKKLRAQLGIANG